MSLLLTTFGNDIAPITFSYRFQMNYRIEIRDRVWSHPDSQLLRQLQREEIAATYGRSDSEPGTAPSADDMSVFVVAYLHSNAEGGASDGIPIACGGLRSIPPAVDSPGDVEIKRMYVHHDYRGKPWFAARAVLIALEKRAWENGWMNVILETGKLQLPAIKFYQREGYVEIPKFGPYAQSDHSRCFRKMLEKNRKD